MKNISIWRIKVNGRTETFATYSYNIQEAIRLYKTKHEKDNPKKAFNVDFIEWVNGMEVLEDKRE